MRSTSRNAQIGAGLIGLNGLRSIRFDETKPAVGEATKHRLVYRKKLYRVLEDRNESAQAVHMTWHHS